MRTCRGFMGSLRLKPLPFLWRVSLSWRGGREKLSAMTLGVGAYCSLSWIHPRMKKKATPPRPLRPRSHRNKSTRIGTKTRNEKSILPQIYLRATKELGFHLKHTHIRNASPRNKHSPVSPLPPLQLTLLIRCSDPISKPKPPHWSSYRSSA